MKSLLIVGGSSDIGIATIKELVEQYELIIASYYHMNDELETLVSQHENLICVKANLTDEEDVKNLIQFVVDKCGAPEHILHLPATKYQARKFHKTAWNVYEEELQVSLRSLVMIMSAFLPKMAKKKYGRVVVMLSMVVNGMPPKHNADYVIVKHALLGLVKATAVEYAEYGITVNGVSPALVETKFVENMHELLIEQNAGLSPTGRNLEVGDVIPTIAYLFSDAAACINGQNISITCGR